YSRLWPMQSCAFRWMDDEHPMKPSLGIGRARTQRTSLRPHPCGLHEGAVAIAQDLLAEEAESRAAILTIAPLKDVLRHAVVRPEVKWRRWIRLEAAAELAPPGHRPALELDRVPVRLHLAVEVRLQ